MSDRNAVRRVLLAGGFVAVLASGLGWWLLADQENTRPPPASRSTPALAPVDEPAPVGWGRSSSTSSPRKNSSRLRGSTLDLDRPDASSNTPTLIDQLIAIHAIASQADVSRFLEENAELAARHVDRFCEESKGLAPSPFLERPRKLDAATFMQPLSDWTEPTRLGQLHLPDVALERINAAGEHWPEHLNAADFRELDFSWLSALEAFDHWSLKSVEPEHGLNAPELVLAIPNYLTLLAWAKLRLAQAMSDGDLRSAARQVRHLAELIRSQRILLAEMVAIQFLKIERQAFEAAQRRGLDVSRWTVVAAPEQEKLRRLSRVEASFLLPGVDPTVMKKALACAPSPCVAVGEAAWVHVSIGSFSPAETGPAFWEIAEGVDCDRELLDLVQSGGTMSPEKARVLFEVSSPLERVFGPSK